jgi:hypothetical protein
MININALKWHSVYSSFISFVASFQYMKLPKYTKMFWILSHTHLHYNHYDMKPFDTDNIERLTQIS